MKVLIACEESQVVCKALRSRGHEAYSCDILPPSGGKPEWHIQDDVIYHLKGWDMIIAFDPCTYQCNSGVRWLWLEGDKKNLKRWEDLDRSCNLTNLILEADCPLIARENPIPHRYAVKRIGRKYDQIIHPWQFGHGETKATCLWLKGLPLLEPTNIVEGREQRIWKMPPGPDRSKQRSKTYTGIAEAMAEQWGCLKP